MSLLRYSCFKPTSGLDAAFSRHVASAANWSIFRYFDAGRQGEARNLNLSRHEAERLSWNRSNAFAENLLDSNLLQTEMEHGAKPVSKLLR
jgi:hypothetical protein